MSLDELFAPHMPQLYRAAVQVLRHPQDSEDAVQEGLLAAFRHLSQFQGRSKFSTWLHRIVVNAAFMKLRHRKREINVSSIDDEFENGDLSFERLIPDQRQNPENRQAVYPAGCDPANESYSHVHTFMDGSKVAFAEKIFNWEHYQDPFIR